MKKLMVRVVYPNGLTVSWAYDANSQLLQVSNATPSNIISQYDYAYDAAGRRVSCAKSGNAFTQDDTVAYGYNNRSELTNAVAAVDANYRYAYNFDEIGNRIVSTECRSNLVYVANNLNQYTLVGRDDPVALQEEFAPKFDDDGNQTLLKTATGIWQVFYNGENRPVRWENGDTVITMSYDRIGRRVMKDNKKFVYNGFLQISDNVGNAYIWDPVELVATRPLVWFLAGNPAYYVHDGNKNVSEVILANGAVSDSYEYAPFGAVVRQCGAGASTNVWRFSSEFAEHDTGTVYYNFRHYEPLSGRWLNRDMVEEQFGIYSEDGLFVSFLNDPIGVVDAIGLSPVSYKANRWEHRKIRKPVGGYDKKGNPRGRMREDTEKFENCTLTVQVGLKVSFKNDLTQDDVKWTKDKQEKWKAEAKSVVEGYFDSVKLKCYASDECCKICQEGVKVKLVLVFNEGAQIVVSNDPNSQSCVNYRRSGGHLDVGDVDEQQKVSGTCQVPIIHEIGHLLGLDHPGGNSNSRSAYEKDINSLMGGGMEMRPHDFEKAFCSKIKIDQLAKGTEALKCKKWEAR